MWLNRLPFESLSEPILQGWWESPRGITSFVGEIASFKWRYPIKADILENHKVHTFYWDNREIETSAEFLEASYYAECQLNNTRPLSHVVQQIQEKSKDLTLKGEKLDLPQEYSWSLIRRNYPKFLGQKHNMRDFFVRPQIDFSDVASSYQSSCRLKWTTCHMIHDFPEMPHFTKAC